MRGRIIPLVLASALAPFGCATAQPTPGPLAIALQASPLEAVVLIDAEWTDEAGGILRQERGAGIVLGERGPRLFVATAAHVVWDSLRYGTATDIQVSFRAEPDRPRRAQFVDRRAHLDFAVVGLDYVDSYILERLAKLRPDTAYSWPAGRPVLAVGHPGTRLWHQTAGTVRGPAGPNRSAFLSSKTDSIVAGNSGGPLLSEENRLIGMVTGVSGQVAYALPLGPLFSQLNQMNVPYQPRLAADFSAIPEITKLVDDHHADRLRGPQCAPKEHDLYKFHRAKVQMFGRGEALIVTPLSDDEGFYLERVGSYGSQRARDEAYRVLWNELTPWLKGWRIDRDTVAEAVFRRFQVAKWNVRVAITNWVNSLYLVVYRPEAGVMKRGSFYSAAGRLIGSRMECETE